MNLLTGGTLSKPHALNILPHKNEPILNLHDLPLLQVWCLLHKKIASMETMRSAKSYQTWQHKANHNLRQQTDSGCLKLFFTRLSCVMARGTMVQEGNYKQNHRFWIRTKVKIQYIVINWKGIGKIKSRAKTTLTTNYTEIKLCVKNI